MKYTLNRLARANEDKKTSILQSTLTEIENDSDLEAKVGELLPFLSDKDRNMRIQAITVLSFFNTQFKIPAVRKAIAEMAAIKLADSACLQASCEIISTNIDILDSEQLNDTFDKLISIDLRVNLYAARLSAYQLFDKIIKKGISITKPSIVEKFKVFCGYEQDPRCLKVVFNIFQKFTNLIIDKLDKAQISELFDVVSVFYPISQNTDLANQLSECLASNPKFADDLAELVSAKLKNSLADTRTPIYRSLSILLVHKTKPELVVSVVSSFIISLREHFEGGSTATDENTVNSAITSIVKFVELNPDSHQMLSSIAISEWISTEIIESENMNSIRAYSIVSWNIDKVIHFSKQVIAPLAAVVQKSFESHDENRVQSILASIVEFLKLQDFHDLTDDSFTPFLTIANNSLLSDNRNLHITSLVIIRELSNHLHLPFNPTLLTNLLMHIELEPFSTSALNSLSTQTELIPLSIDEKECMKHKTKVIRKLRMALDDDKREIRKEAADAKLAWMKLTEE
ncbi:hypothetical protein GPJ56_001786 [Histomonas meleagridis]|uniref:uncharacterized protein n=1 Tax=Histomonas meleagridis TaxID=135588 RepID=UPI00355A91E7|nr:hypothetical protein GPJ56_001786 [Histomonas meleagridis]KAH0803277.1 hypothetical protein GO595_004013 [Histomonas meleagridis]